MITDVAKFRYTICMDADCWLDEFIKIFHDNFNQEVADKLNFFLLVLKIFGTIH